MASKHALILVTLVILHSSAEDPASNDVDPLAEARAAIMKEQNLQNVGNILSNLVQSEGAKQIGDILMNAATGEEGGQLLQGLGAAMNFFQSSSGPKGEEGDLNVLTLLGKLMGPEGNANLMGYLPILLQTMNAFVGPEAEARAKSHAGHSMLMPPFMEKVHVMFDHFMNSEMGKRLMEGLGAEKFVRVFADESGRYSYKRMVEMLENHSFRKHWLKMVTDRIALMLSYISDLKSRRAFVTTFQHFVNSILKSQSFPKSALYDPTRPVDSITAIVNYIFKEYLKMKIDTREYVKPAVKYIQDLFNLASKKGILGSDRQQLSDKLADTINMEIIEPLARVNRAYRFALKNHECDKYVMCLVNQKIENDDPSLPGLKPLLSKTSSLIFGWFLSSYSNTPFWTLYHVISEQSDSCKKYYIDKCNDFHIEEMKVTTEYVHNEL